MDEHYFTADPSVAFARAEVSADLWGLPLTWETGSGTFAHGRLDIGTAVLFRHTAAPGPGTFLDLGCGNGVIGLAVAASDPGADVWAVDVNERALRVANENAANLGLADRFRAVLPDAVPGDVRFDEIWSNPPIRVGKRALHDLLLRWLPRLAPDGRAVMVVGKNLGADSLQRWLGEQGFPTERLASAKGFRILVTRPGAS